MVRIDGKSMLLPERTFLFLPPGHLLLRLSCTQDFLFQYLSFSFDFLSDFPLLLKADISNQVTNAPPALHCCPIKALRTDSVDDTKVYAGREFLTE